MLYIVMKMIMDHAGALSVLFWKYGNWYFCDTRNKLALKNPIWNWQISRNLTSSKQPVIIILDQGFKISTSASSFPSREHLGLRGIVGSNVADSMKTQKINLQFRHLFELTK